jgi:DNA-binding transcriptional regulator YdaS (Cro superfamily)
VDDLERTAGEIDLSDRRNFHHMMWLIMALGGNQTAYAERHGYQPTTVSRWVNGAVAPPKLRRRPIILDAIEHLQINLKEGLAVPLKDFTDEDSQGATKAHAGRPVRRPYPVT